MFSSLGLFKDLACPDLGSCSRPHCLYSHSPNVPQPRTLTLAVPPTSLLPSIRRGPEKPRGAVTHAKRPAIASPTKGSPGYTEPPRKIQKVGPTLRPLALPSAPQCAEVSLHRFYVDGHSHLFSVRCSYSTSQCSPVSSCDPRQTG
jgi:RNA exonuclease 1